MNFDNKPVNQKFSKKVVNIFVQKTWSFRLNRKIVIQTIYLLVQSVSSLIDVVSGISDLFFI